MQRKKSELLREMGVAINKKELRVVKNSYSRRKYTPP